VAVGADTEAVEAVPSGDPTNPHPVHLEFLVREGIYVMEMVYLEELAADRVFEFLFICLPPRIRGATGAFIRPIAVI
jgi:kynurenine formamidase